MKNLRQFLRDEALWLALGCVIALLVLMVILK